MALSSDGDRLVSGAPGHKRRRGIIEAFDCDSRGPACTPVGNSKRSDEGSAFGSAVAISRDGERIAGGAPNAKIAYVRYFVFDVDAPSSWTELGDKLTGKGGFGGALSLSGDGKPMVVGSSSASEGGTIDGGRFDVYKYETDPADGTEKWFQHGSVTGDKSNGKLGLSVSMDSSGRVVAAGSPGFAAGKGSASMYEEEVPSPPPPVSSGTPSPPPPPGLPPGSPPGTPPGTPPRVTAADVRVLRRDRAEEEEAVQRDWLGEVRLPEEGQAVPPHARERGQVHRLQEEEDLRPRGAPVLGDRQPEGGLVRLGGDDCDDGDGTGPPSSGGPVAVRGAVGRCSSGGGARPPGCPPPPGGRRGPPGPRPRGERAPSRAGLLRFCSREPPFVLSFQSLLLFYLFIKR